MENILKISYSKLFDLPQVFNSAELYETACSLGFDAVKGDVAVTADNQLVMCHDSFFRFDENGRVFDSCQAEEAEGQTKDIVEMTYEECMGLEYNTPEFHEFCGTYAKVVGVEEYLRICKAHQKKAYITVRDTRIPEVTKELYRLLVAYDMVEQCIINSFAYETLVAMRRLDARFFFSQVHPPILCAQDVPNRLRHSLYAIKLVPL